MATTPTFLGNAMLYEADDGVNDNDVLLTTGDVSKYDSFLLMSTAGAMDVFVSLDGTNFSTAPLSLQDFGATTTNPVLVTVANRVYGFRGKFRFVRLLQNGAAAVVNPHVICGNT